MCNLLILKEIKKVKIVVDIDNRNNYNVDNNNNRFGTGIVKEDGQKISLQLARLASPPDTLVEKSKSEIKKKRLGEAQEFAARIIDDPGYRKQLKLRAINGNLPTGIEVLLWYYRFGRPVNKVELGTPGDFDLSELSNQELNDRAKRIAEETAMLEGVH